MKIITLEEHMTTPWVMEQLNRFKAPQKTEAPQTPEMKELLEFYKSKMYLGKRLLDFEDERLPYMDRNGITMQVLSYQTLICKGNIPAEDAVTICRKANDLLYEIIQRHPDRFRGFATLPMIAPEEAARELERCVKELGFCGTLLSGQINGHFFDEPQFRPVFEKAAELDVPVSFHPDFVAPQVADYYYKSPSWSLVVQGEFGSAGLGWHYDVGVHVMRMILSGIFDELPSLRLITGHWGETIPSFLDRIDFILKPEVTKLKKKVSDYYRENIYITPSGIMSRNQLEYTVKVFGADHVLYATDYPYMLPENVKEFLGDSCLTEEEQELISHRNAERLLHI